MNDGGRAIDVAYSLSVFGRDIDYNLAHRLGADGVLRWTLDPDRANDLRRLDGEFEVHPAWEGGGTLLVYRSRVEIDAPLPRWVEDSLTRRSLASFLRSLRDHAEAVQ